VVTADDDARLNAMAGKGRGVVTVLSTRRHRSAFPSPSAGRVRYPDGREPVTP